MSNEELITLNTQELTEETARVMGIELLNQDLDLDKAAAKREALVSAVLTGAAIATGMNDPVSYSIMGVDAVFLFQLFQKLQAIYKKKKMLKQFEGETYQDSYIDFIKTCQEYVSKQRHVDTSEKSR